MQLNPPRASAAHLTVPKRPRAAPSPSFTERLRSLAEASGPNKNDQVIVLISACIAEGIDAGEQIIGTVVRLGFNPTHAAIQLKTGCGTNPALYRWCKAENGRYSLLH